MMENRNQFRIAIATALNKMNFYYLPLAKLTEILKLLEMPETSEANAILQNVYTGVMRLYQKHKQKIVGHLFNEKFSSISKESKQLLYTIFIQIHSILMSKQQSIPHSTSLPSYNMGIYYPQPTNLGLNFMQQQSPYSQDMKKYMEMYRMFPYNLMNPSMNPNINPNLQSGINSQFSMPIHVSNPYFNYPNSHNMGISYGQVKNTPRALPIPGMSYGMNPFSTSSGIPSMYSPQYVNPFSTGMVGGGLGQITPPPFSHIIAAEKSDPSSKISESSKSTSINLIQKKTLNPVTNKNQREKSIQKNQKQTSSSSKSTNNQLTDNISNKIDNKSKPAQSNEFLPKKLPYEDTKKLNEPNLQFKSCACKGYFEYQNNFICNLCKNKFHYRCLGINDKKQVIPLDQITCAHCKMRNIDLLNKVQQSVGQFYLMNLVEKGFQTTLNLKPYEFKCRQKNSKYQIQFRCIRSGEHIKNLEITWPDECIIKINNDKIVDIPALQSNSSLKKRKDFSVFMTQNIFSRVAYMNGGEFNLQKVKISLELKQMTPQEASSKRIRNDFTFALGIYLVQKLNSDELYAKIISQQKCQDQNFLRNLMKTTENQVQIDKLTIRLIDPYSWQLIKTPVRGSKCTHAQCFDLKTFISLMYSAKNRTWKCPLCLKDSRKFMLDNQQVELIKKAEQLQPIPKQVSIYKSGKVAFKIQKYSQDEDQGTKPLGKTKKIVKQRKQQIIKQK